MQDLEEMKDVKLTTTVGKHASCTGKLVLLETLLLNDLLRCDVADRKEHGRRDTLRQQWTSREATLVPVNN